MDKIELAEYLIELQSALQELNDDLVKTSGVLRDPELENDLYNNIGFKLDDAITNINVLISDVENGEYDDPEFESDDN